MRPPLLLFLKDSKEFELFRSLVELESDIEAIDVMNDEYEAYDSDGLRVDLDVNERDFPRATVSSDQAQSRVRKLILEHYAPANPKFREDLTFAELIEGLKQIYKYKP